MATSRMTDQVGRVLGGRYRLLAPIGTGASANVFLAEDVVLRRRVAVKVLHAALAQDEPFLRRFQAEARAAAALSHPHVMAVFDWGEDDDGPFLVLELLGGGSLRGVLDRGHRLSPSQSLLVGLQAARGLDYAHRRGLVHRDIKPANLLFDEEGGVRIADFGVARALAEAAWTEPSGAVIGSARYSSPEQAQGGSLDGRSDVYSLAIAMVEAATGTVPFTADTTIATLMARIGATYTAPPELGSLGPVLEHALQPDAAARPDAAALTAELEAAARELPRPEPLPVGEAVTIDITSSIDPDPTILAGSPTRAESAPRTRTSTVPSEPVVLDGAGRRRRWWPYAVLACLLAAILAGGGLLVARARTPSHPVPNVIGQDVKKATNDLRALKFHVRAQSARKDGSTPGQVISQRPTTGSLKEGRAVTLTVSEGNTLVTVPSDLVNQDRTVVLPRLQQLGLTVQEQPQRDPQVPKGKVIAVADAGRQLAKGSTVVVTVSQGPPPVTMPDFTGQSFAQAKATLEQHGLVAVEFDDYTDAVQTGQVFATDPPKGADVEVGSRVTVKVSKGPKTVTVPDVKGRNVDQATAMMQDAGLQVTGVFGPHGPKGKVVSTDPSGGTKVQRGGGVVLYTN